MHVNAIEVKQFFRGVYPPMLARGHCVISTSPFNCVCWRSLDRGNVSKRPRVYFFVTGSLDHRAFICSFQNGNMSDVLYWRQLNLCQVDFSRLLDTKEGISYVLLNVELRGILPRDL